MFSGSLKKPTANIRLFSFCYIFLPRFLCFFNFLRGTTLRGFYFLAFSFADSKFCTIFAFDKQTIDV